MAFGARHFTAATPESIALGTADIVTGTLLTIAAWINPATTPSASVVLSRWGATFDYILTINSGKIVGAVGDGSTNIDNIATGATTLSTGVWAHAAYTWTSGATGKVYLNGVLDGTSGPSAGFTIATNSHAIDIGIQNDNAGPYDGSIADCAVWNVSLTVAELAALAQGARPNTIRPGSLKGYWPLNGIQSPEPDLSGNGFNGTLTGTTNAAGPPITLFTPRWLENPTFPTETPPVLWAQSVF